MPFALEIRANFQDQSGEHMQIREITQRLNENALGAFASGFAQGAGIKVPENALGSFASGFAQGAGINVPDTGGAGNTVTGYGDARQKAAAAAAKPMIALLAKQEMQAWNVAIADMLKKEKVQDRKQLSPASKSELERDLDVRLHKVLMKGSVGTNYAQGLPANVDELSQPKAKALVDQLTAAKQDILNFDQSATAQQQLAQWQTLSQAAYDAMSLTQFYPDKRRMLSGTMPKILPNPGGGYNIGSYTLTGDPVDQLIAQKIQAELKTNPKADPQLRANRDGSINIGAQRLDPRNPDEAKAIARIESAMDGSAPTAPGPDAAGNTTSPGGIIIPAGARTAESTKKKKNVLVNQAYKSKYQK
jgi:hypothetical protein